MHLDEMTFKQKSREVIIDDLTLFGPDGGLVSNAPHIPVHLGAMQDTVRHQMNFLGSNFKYGDIVQVNLSVPQFKLCMTTLPNVLQKEKLDNMSLIPDCEGKKHPVESSHFTGTKCNWTWNSEIYTLDIRIVDASVSLKGHGREKPIPIFDGKSPIIQKSSKLPNTGQLPGKAFPETVKKGWLKFTFQWPSGSLTHQVLTLL